MWVPLKKCKQKSKGGEIYALDEYQVPPTTVDHSMMTASFKTTLLPTPVLRLVTSSLSDADEDSVLTYRAEINVVQPQGFN